MSWLVVQQAHMIEPESLKEITPGLVIKVQLTGKTTNALITNVIASNKILAIAGAMERNINNSNSIQL